MKINFAKRLKELREERELTATELAYDLNISRSSITMYEIGQREPNLETIVKFAEFFNVTVDYMVGKEKSMATNENSNIEKFELLHELQNQSLNLSADKRIFLIEYIIGTLKSDLANDKFGSDRKFVEEFIKGYDNKKTTEQ